MNPARIFSNLTQTENVYFYGHIGKEQGIILQIVFLNVYPTVFKRSQF